MKIKIIKRILLIILSVLILFSIVAFIGVHIAYSKIFSRSNYDEYNKKYNYTYEEIDTDKYPRETLSVLSGDNMLVGYLYGKENSKGLIVISPGHRDASDIKLPEIMYFVDQGWKVLCYDYTGCYRSEGSNMVSYMQSPKDLNVVLDYVESNNQFKGLPVMLFGHSLGAYASSVVLEYGHNITAVVAASGFDDPMEQWGYSVKRSTGIFGNAITPYAKLYMGIRFGREAHLSAIDGINSTDIPVLIMQGTKDEYYGNVSSIYEHRDKITNPNCTIQVMDEENHNAHYDYFLSDDAIKYKEKIENGNDYKDNSIDKFLYMDHNTETMDYINEFFLKMIRN